MRIFAMQCIVHSVVFLVILKKTSLSGYFSEILVNSAIIRLFYSKVTRTQ